MKKVLLLIILSVLVIGCMPFISEAERLADTQNPYKEYKVKNIDVANILEEGILEQEAEQYGFDLIDTSGHVISMTKYGDYFEGTVKIIGSLTDAKLEEIKKVTKKDQNEVVSYECMFEYSAKTGHYLWRSLYKDPLN